jgi:hypothetical protein
MEVLKEDEDLVKMQTLLYFLTKFQLDLTMLISRTYHIVSVKLIIRLLNSYSQIKTRQDTPFQTHLLEVCQTQPTCHWIALVSRCFKIHSDSSSEAQDNQTLSMFTPIALTLL